MSQRFYDTLSHGLLHGIYKIKNAKNMKIRATYWTVHFGEDQEKYSKRVLQNLAAAYNYENDTSL